MSPRRTTPNTPATQSTQSTQSTLIPATSLKTNLKPILHNLLHTASRLRSDKPLKTKTQQYNHIERLRQHAEAVSDLHDLIERWMRCHGDDNEEDLVFGAPSEHWKALHPQMNYHLQRIRHREQHALWGAKRLPVCGEKDRATIAFLNCGGDVEEMGGWDEGLEEEFLDSLVWRWKGDTGV